MIPPCGAPVSVRSRRPVSVTRPALRHEIVLKRCPFQEVATSYQAVICPLHLGLIRGALAELGTGVEADWLEPFAEPAACVGHLTGA